MRIHADKYSPYFWRNNFEYQPRIFLDGIEVDEVIEADDEEGFVSVIRMNGSGHPVFAGGGYMLDRLTGVVEIVPPF